MKVLIAPDKFKGTLTAREAAAAIASGWRQSRPNDDVQVLPASDGGDGFGEVLGGLLSAEPRRIETVDAAHRHCHALWWWSPSTKTAVIDSARIIGLAMLPAGKFHPFELDTFGLGAVLRGAAGHGAERCFIGIGGSATNDGGFGVARALGWQFQSRHGHVLNRWHELHDLALIHHPRETLEIHEVIVAVDVQNPLLGPSGCTRVYGPQKGLKVDEFEFAERCLGRLEAAVQKDLRVALGNTPGAGAAGGLGFGLMAFAGAKPRSGFSIFAEETGLRQRIQEADLVVTGEGALDDQSLMGKGVGELARLCQRADVPCLALAGVCTMKSKTESPFNKVHALTPEFTSASEAMTRPALTLERLAADVASGWSHADARRKGPD